MANKRTFLTDIWRKLIAFLLALLTWVLFTEQHPTTSELQNIKVTLKYDTQKYVLQQPNPTVTIKVVSRFIPVEYKARDFYIVAQIQPGKDQHGSFVHRIVLDETNLNRVPLGKITFHPSELELNMDTIEEKEVPIKPDIKGQVAAQHQAKIILNPKSTKLRGTLDVLQKIQHLTTEPVEIPENCKKGFMVEAKLLKPVLNKGEFLTVEHDKATVNLQVRHRFAGDQNEHRLWDRQILLMNAVPPRFEVKTPTIPLASVTLNGDIPSTILNKIQPYVDLTGITKPGTHELNVELLNLPAGVTSQCIPATIKIDLEPPQVPPTPSQAKP